MATDTMKTEYGDSGVLSSPPVKMSWGAIFGGAVAALGLWLMLYALGLALGLSAMSPADPGSAKGAGIFTGIWGLVAPLIALFVGGLVAGRGAGGMTKTGGAMHGLVMWGLTTLVGAYLLANLLGSVLGTAASAGQAVAGAAGGAVVGAARGAANNPEALQGAARAFGLDASDALRPVNERLQREGMPAVTAAQLEAATKDVVADAVRQGQLDRNLLVNSIAQQTALSRQDAEELAGRVEAQFNQAKGQVSSRVEDVKQDVQAGALKAADTTGKVFWGLFGSLFLGLLAALFGATAGVSRRQRIATQDADTPGGLGVRREVYP